MYPVTNILSKRGISITLLTSKKVVHEEIDPELFTKSRFIFCEDYQLENDRFLSQSCCERLQPTIEQMCDDLRLDEMQRNATNGLFRHYFREKICFQRVLLDVRPSVIYGIHYVLNPGYIGAIEATKKKGWKMSSILMQHGFFNARGYHDFKGADCVIVWGKYFEDVLTKMIAGPTPSWQIIGNPKLEVELSRASRQRTDQQLFNKTRQQDIILFLTEPGDYDARAVELFSRAVGNRRRWKVVYKLHPSQSIEDYNCFVNEGLIRPEQLIKDVDLYGLIQMAAVVVGTKSTALLEAMALGKPVIQLLPELSRTDWIEHGLATASTERELHEQICKVEECSDYREEVLRREQKLVREMFGIISGASERIADFLESLL